MVLVGIIGNGVPEVRCNSFLLQICCCGVGGGDGNASSINRCDATVSSLFMVVSISSSCAFLSLRFPLWMKRKHDMTLANRFFASRRGCGCGCGGGSVCRCWYDDDDNGEGGKVWWIWLLDLSRWSVLRNRCTDRPRRNNNEETSRSLMLLNPRPSTRKTSLDCLLASFPGGNNAFVKKGEREVFGERGKIVAQVFAYHNKMDIFP